MYYMMGTTVYIIFLTVIRVSCACAFHCFFVDILEKITATVIILIIIHERSQKIIPKQVILACSFSREVKL